MFEDKDMMVSMPVVIKKMRELKDEAKEQYEKLQDEFKDFINTTKEMAGYTGDLSLDVGNANVYFKVGFDTGFEIDGIKVFTGDELRLVSLDRELNGILGIATLVDGKPYWRSNAECGFMQKSIKYEFVRHFVHYKHGEEIAKGRRGNKGFFVNLNKKEQLT